jgi:HAE1 family hydrophobic/amphiphilic exporter-1
MKALAKMAVKRPVTFFMISLIVIGFGFFGLTGLKRSLYPNVSFPTVTIYTTYAGVAPQDMETLITRPIEEQVSGISGVQKITSHSSQGASVIELKFNWGKNLYNAESDVRKKLDIVRRQLPKDADQPIVYSYNPNQKPFMILALTSKTRSQRALRTISEQQLQQRIDRIPGVATSETYGGYERQINVNVDNAKMRLYNIDLSAIATKLSQENIQVPAGQITQGHTIYALRTIGRFQNIDQISNTIIAMRNGQAIKLSDVAKVIDGVARPIGAVQVNGQSSVIVDIFKQSDANVVEAASRVKNSIPQFEQALPTGIHIDVLTDNANFIKSSITDLLWTGLEAVFLVICVLLLFLRSGRSALIIGISIPISIIATFAIMDWMNVSLNTISLSGLTLAVGLVVDDAVVVLENIFRWQQAKEHKTAAVYGAQEVAVPVASSTITTLVVFLPILFVPGIAGFLFRDMALTISFALIMSLLIALSLIPMLSSLLFTDEEDEGAGRKNETYLARLLRWGRGSIFKKILIAPLLLLGIIAYPLVWVYTKIRTQTGFFFSERVAPFLGRAYDHLEKFYHRKLDDLLDHSAAVVIAIFIFFLITLPIFLILNGTFFPSVDRSAFTLQVKREPGVILVELGQTFNQVEHIIKKNVPEATLVVAQYGKKKGVEGVDNPSGNQGTVDVELVPRNQRHRSQQEIVASLVDSLQVVPGAQIKQLKSDPLRPQGNNGLIVQVFGFNPEVRKDLVTQVESQMQTVKGIQNVFSSADQGRPELRVKMNRERISRLGMTTSEVATNLSNAIKGNQATTYLNNGLLYNVVVRLNPLEKISISDLDALQIQTPDSTYVPLTSVASIQQFVGPSNVMRINEQRVTEITADLQNIDLKKATARVQQKLQNIDWSPGFRYEIAGSAQDQEASFHYLLVAFIVAIILVYMVMAAQFESLVEPFIIILTIPLALSGVLIALWITGTAISVTSMVGVILLSGIVVKNGIVMIDYIKILQSRHQERHEAIVNGAARRLRPILMTASVTALAMVPLALNIGSGSETWSPMARAVIGGLFMSTLLMLVFVPCLYNLINTKVEKMGFDSIHKEDPLALNESADGNEK